MNPYPNIPRRNPITQTVEQEHKKDALKSLYRMESPILDWLEKFLDEKIEACDSIDSLQLDLRSPETVVRQIAAMKMLKDHLNRIKGEVKNRQDMANSKD